jgi:hypothetical protein
VQDGRNEDLVARRVRDLDVKVRMLVEQCEEEQAATRNKIDRLAIHLVR